MFCPSSYRLLITPLVSSNLWPLYCMFFDLPTSDYPLGIFKHLAITFSALQFTDCWLPLWYLPIFDHCIVCSSIYCFWLPICYLQTFGHYLVWPSFYGFWIPLSYLQTFGHSIVSFDLQLLITPLVSSNLVIVLSVIRFMASAYPFDIFKLFVPYIVIGYIVDHYCLMFIREVAPVVLLLTITVWQMSKFHVVVVGYIVNRYRREVPDVVVHNIIDYYNFFSVTGDIVEIEWVSKWVSDCSLKPTL